MNRAPPTQVRHGAQIPEPKWLCLEVALVQPLGEVSGLLGRHLRRLGQRGLAVDDSAIADDEHVVEQRAGGGAGAGAGGGVIVIGACVFASIAAGGEAHAETVVYDDAAGLGVLGQSSSAVMALALGRADGLLHELFDQRVLHQPRGPHHNAGADFGGAGLLDLEAQPAGAGRVGADALDGVVRLDGDVLALEQAHGVVGERLLEHWEDLGGDVVYGDADVGHQSRVDLGNVVVDEVVQFGGVFYSCGPAAYDGEVEEFAACFVGWCFGGKGGFVV